jgi:hypothetical protein
VRGARGTSGGCSGEPGAGGEGSLVCLALAIPDRSQLVPRVVQPTPTQPPTPAPTQNFDATTGKRTDLDGPPERRGEKRRSGSPGGSDGEHPGGNGGRSFVWSVSSILMGSLQVTVLAPAPTPHPKHHPCAPAGGKYFAYGSQYEASRRGRDEGEPPQGDLKRSKGGREGGGGKEPAAGGGAWTQVS